MTLQDYGIGAFEITCAAIGVQGFIFMAIFEICSYFSKKSRRKDPICRECPWYTNDFKWCTFCKNHDQRYK